jgi:hypothetical protein
MPQRLAKEIEEEFMSFHIPRIWEELKVRFGFNLKYWKVEFAKYLKKHSREFSEVDVFYRFGNERINNLLNAILGRANGYPTFNNLVKYVVWDKSLKERKS